MAGLFSRRGGHTNKVGSFRILISFFRQDLFSVSFLLSMALIFLALLYSKDISGPGTSAVGLFIFPISWNNAMGLVALAAGICSASNFAQERATKYSRYILVRTTRKRYIIVRFISICLSTGCALFVAFFLFGLFCFYDAGGTLLPIAYSQVDAQIMSDLLTGGFPVLWFISILVVQFMFGVVLGGLGACATAFIPNRFIGYSAPFIILFIWSQVCSWIGLPVWVNPLGLSKFTYMTADTTVTFVTYIAAFLAVTILLFLVFSYKGSKEVKNDN